MALDALSRRARAALASIPGWILALFALGIAIRLALMVVYAPAALQNLDTISYIAMPPFVESRQASGMHLLIEPFEWIGSLTLLVLAQHALGVVTAALLAAAARRLGCGWVATGAVAAVALLGSNVLYLEHAVLTEPLFTMLAAGALLAALSAGGGMLSALVAGAAAGASLCTRSIGLAVIAAAALGVLLMTTGPARRRAARTGVTLAAAAAVIGAYLLGVAATENGKAGFGQWSGWYTYARAASFADCREFKPPPGTEMLCETSDPQQRPGPSFYMFDPASPARIAFGEAPWHGDLLRRFGRAAILGQPRAYAHAVLRDFLRYVDDDLGREQERSGGGYATIALDRRDFPGEQVVADGLAATSFGPVDVPRVKAANAVELYAAVFEVDGRVLLLLLVMSAAAVAVAHGVARAGAAVYLALSLALLAIPAMTIIYNARYALPAALLLTVPAALGGEAIARRVTSGAADGARA